MGTPWYAWLGTFGALALVAIIVWPNSRAYRPCSPRLTRLIRISALGYGLLTAAYYLGENRLPGPAVLAIAILAFLSVIVLCIGVLAARKSGSRGTT